MMAAHREVLDAVSVVAQQRGMTLVMKFNGDPVEQGNPQSIMREVGKLIVYNSRETDITPAVLDEISRPQGNAGTNPRAAGRPGVPRPN
jgi:hypothetical protein